MTTPEASSTPPSAHSRGADGRSGAGFGRNAALFAILAGFWYLLSGRIGVQYAIFMVVTITIVLALNPERPFGPQGRAAATGLAGRVRGAVYLVRYLVWLVWKVLAANVDVAIRILHPKLPIQPRLMRFRTELRSEVAQVLVANSITLTPGTVTIDLQDGEYLVHALHPATTDAILSGELERTVAPIFGEEAGDPPDVRWSSTFRERDP